MTFYAPKQFAKHEYTHISLYISRQCVKANVFNSLYAEPF